MQLYTHLVSHSTAHVLGAVGSALVILAYWGLKLNTIKSTDLVYDVLNLFGAILLGISLVFNFNLGSFLIEIFMGGAALFGIITWFKSASNRKRGKENVIQFFNDMGLIHKTNSVRPTDSFVSHDGLDLNGNAYNHNYEHPELCQCATCEMRRQGSYIEEP